MEKNTILAVNNISKQYPGTLALDDVSMEIRSGEVVGLVGENGAGKSTLLKLIMGVESPSSGDMVMHNQGYKPQTPIEANRSGIGMVFQEQSLVQNLSVAENLFFGQEDNYTKYGLINKRQMNKDAVEVLEAVDIHNIKTEKKVYNYDFAERQMIEIAKVFHVAQREDHLNSIILLDEPTSVLSENEVNHLFHNIRKMTDKGDSVVFISHRLDEVMEISDRIYVFKDGKRVAELDAKDANEEILYEKMVGKTASGEYYKLNRQREASDELLLEVEHLGLKGFFNDVSFKLHRGEILGITGVIGSGKEELCSVICGDEIPSNGEILVNGRKSRANEPYQSLKNGILIIPKERREEAIIPDKSIYENISMSNYGAISQRGIISSQKEKEQAHVYVKKLSIKTPNIQEQIGNLSGGNAQKVVFARALASDASILILNHPTRGVDIGAKEEIYSLIRDLADHDKGIILIGDTLDECIGLSSRILVMKDGKITHQFDSPASEKPEQVDIVKYMM